MFYSNTLNLKSVTYKKYNLSSFANGLNANIEEQLLPLNTAVNTYNFNMNNGALKTGLGIKDVSVSYNSSDRSLKKSFNLPEGLEACGVWEYNRWNSSEKVFESYILVYCSDGNIYKGYMYHQTSLLTQITGLHFTNMPKVVSYYLNGLDVVILSTSEDGMWVWNTEIAPYQIVDAPQISSMCLHYERLFATIKGDNRTIWFSDDLDPTNWNVTLNEGGFISLYDERGGAIKVLSFEEYLYIFRKFGISRLSASGSQENFYINNLFVTNCRIYDNTIVVCDNRIMFLAEDGIYSFNGVTTTKITTNIESMLKNVDNENAVATYNNGKYYVALRLNFNDSDEVGCEENNGYINNTLLEIDLKNGDLNIMRGVDIRFINSIKNELENKVFVVNISSLGTAIISQIESDYGKDHNNNLIKIWKSPKTGFGYPFKEKLIKSITLCTKYDLQVVVNFDGKERAFNLVGKNKPQTIYPNLKGCMFSFKFKCTTQNAEVSNPYIVVGFL